MIANMVDPNRVALFERVERRRDVELLVVYETGMEANRAWTVPADLPFASTLLRSRSLDLRPLGTDAYLHLPVRPLAPLRAFRPDVVVGAGGGIWSSPANILAFATRRLHGWSFVPWWGSFAKDRPTLARRVSEPWVRYFLSRSDACIAYGTRARRELQRLGVDDDAIRCVPNAVPPGAPARARRARSTPLRYLFVGQLIDRKGVPELLEAFEGLPGGELQLAGEGPLRPLVEAAAARDPRIACLGHVDRNGLQQLYAEADVLVLPSRYEVWGLVVNEAIEHGLPVVTTDSVGAADDLVEPGVNGYVVDAGDALALRAAMARFSAWSDAEWETAGAASREIAERWTMDAAADAFVEACLAGLERRPSTIAKRKRPFT